MRYQQINDICQNQRVYFDEYSNNLDVPLVHNKDLVNLVNEVSGYKATDYTIASYTKFLQAFNVAKPISKETYEKYGSKSKTKQGFRNLIDQSYLHLPKYSKTKKQ